jgi:3-oxoacyl-(acyl-carrier-protein) synthase
MSGGIYITGWGAVSPAGWSAGALYEAVKAGTPLPYATAKRTEDAPEYRTRKVPAPSPVPDWMKHNRMRRTTAAARHAVGAAIEALGPERLASAQQGAWKGGVVFCTTNGCVQFSRRFFAEALSNPALASPILFPETVYNAPASHIAALAGSPELNCTLVGDSSQFLRGMDLAAQWLEDGEVESVLVVAAEELDWLTDEALLFFDRDGITAEGAAAAVMEKGQASRDKGQGIELLGVTEAWTYGLNMSVAYAAAGMRKGVSDLLTQDEVDVLLCDGLGAAPRADVAEQAAWTGWQGQQLHLRPVLGEAYGCIAGWQTVVACEAIARGESSQVAISAVGLTEQAVGAVLGGVEHFD